MDIIKLCDLLRTLSSVGIEEVVFEPDPSTEGSTLIRGANKDMNVIVYHSVPYQLTEHPMGVQTVKGLLARVELFDVSVAVLTPSEKNDVVYDLLIKKGKKKASFKCSPPDRLQVPKKVPGDLSITSDIVLEKDYIDHLNNAISAMAFTGSKAERSISLMVVDNKATISIYDGEDDSFSDELEVQFNDTKKFSWDVAPFQRVMRSSEDSQGKARFTISEHGIAVFDLGVLNVLVAPVSR